MKVVLTVTSAPGHRVSEQYLSPSWQGSSVLSLPELPKTHLQNGLSTPLPSSESSSTRLSPPNVSALLDISLPGPPEDVLSQGEPATQISDSIIEIAISSGQYGKYRWPCIPFQNQVLTKIGQPYLQRGPECYLPKYLPNFLVKFQCICQFLASNIYHY